MRIVQFVGLVILTVGLLHHDALAQVEQIGSNNICAQEAPWNRNDGLDPRAASIRSADDWWAPKTSSAHPASGLAGAWSFELRGVDLPNGMATAGQVHFRQEGEGYHCDNQIGCGYKPGPDNAKWLFSGERWAHVGDAPDALETPVDITPKDIELSDNGSFTTPQERYNPFPALSGRFDPDSPDRIVGTWTLDWAGETDTGSAILTRIKPKITAIKFISEITHVIAPGETGCVVLNYSKESWGSGNSSRGNRPRFYVEIIGDNFPAFSRDWVKMWIDPRTRLEIDSASPKAIFEFDPSGRWTGKVLGYRLRVNIWPWSRWGPKVLHVEGQPVTFDYYVQPRYPVQLDAPMLKLVEGHFPKQPAPGQATHVGFRLVNMPAHEARAVVADIAFFDASSMEPAPGLKVQSPVCQPYGEGAARCTIEALATAQHAEFEFQIPMPDNGLRWVATWKHEGSEADTHTRQGHIQADPSPQIIYTFSLSDQDGAFRPQTSDYLYPYPASGRGSVQRREVIVFGKNLPEKFADPAQIVSADPALSYLPRFGAAYQSRYDAAWTDVSRRFKIPLDQLKSSYQLLLLDASITGRPLPGAKSFTLNGKTANWDLKFGGLQARVEFVREVQDPQSGATRAEVLETAYAPERVRVRVTTSQALPLEHIPLVVRLQKTNRTPIQTRVARGEPAAVTQNTIRVTATNSFGRPTEYLSDPIRLVDKGRAHLSPPPKPGDLPVDVFLSGRGPDQLSVEVDAGFIAQSFLLEMTRARHDLPISVTPARFRHPHDPNQTSDMLLKTALQRAAACHDVNIQDWDALSLQASERLTRRVVITYQHHTRTTLVRMAHHAAMLMLRDHLVEKLNTQLILYNHILSSELAQKGYLKAMRLSLDDSSVALNRTKVTAPDGTQVEFGGWPLYENIEHLADRFGTTPEAMARWRLRATAEAIANLSTGISAAAERARAVGDCEVEALLKLTGVGFEAVIASLSPRLMRLNDSVDATGTRRLFWEPDLAARFWITDISRLARRWAQQTQTASDDNKRLLLLFSAATAPVTAGSTGSLFYLLTGTNLATTAVGVADDWTQVHDSRIELDFSRDAAVVLGFARNDQAIRKAVSWHSAYNKTLLAIGMTAFDLASVKEEVAVALFRQKDVVLKGQLAAARIPRGGLRAMGPVERQQVRLFAIRAKAREIASGPEVLIASERRAIDAVEADFRAARTELIREGDRSAQLGTGGELVLPSPFDAKTAIVRFEPVDLNAARQGVRGTIPEEAPVIRMAQAQGGSSTAPPPRVSSGASSGSDPAATVVLPAPDLPKDLMGKLVAAGDNVHARGRALAGEVLLVPPLSGGQPVPFVLGEVRGSGSFSSVLEPITPYADYPTLVKVNFGGHDAAEVYGEAALRNIPSPRFLLPRKIMHVEVKPDATGAAGLFHSVSVVEDMGPPASILIQSGKATDLHRAAIRAALDDINGAGYVFLDFKLNNFSIVERNGRTLVAFFDFGGIVRVKGSNPAIAREMQNVVVGPWLDQRAQLADAGINWPLDSGLLPLLPTQGRKELIFERYADQFADLDQLGVRSPDQLGFWPSAGDELDPATVQLFTSARRGSTD